MNRWATTVDNTKPYHVDIERSIHFPLSTLSKILSLKFNLGGPTAEVATVDLRLSILICGSQSQEAKSFLLRKEQAAERSRRNLTRAEAEEEQLSTTDVSTLPDNYHELLCCLGTYCALLHTLFGPRCLFKQCFALWTTMHSDVVYEHRNLFNHVGHHQRKLRVFLATHVPRRLCHHTSQRHRIPEMHTNPLGQPYLHADANTTIIFSSGLDTWWPDHRCQQQPREPRQSPTGPTSHSNTRGKSYSRIRPNNRNTDCSAQSSADPT